MHWRRLPDLPYIGSSARVVGGVLFAIGGSDGSKRISAIFALHPVNQKWQHVAEMPFECSYVDTVLLSGGRLLVVDGDTQKVTVLDVEGKVILTLKVNLPDHFLKVWFHFFPLYRGKQIQMKGT